MQVVQRYLDDLARGDAESAQARLSQNLTHQVPGRNQLAGFTSGPDAPGLWFALMADLSGGTYSMTAPVDWLASETHSLLLARASGSVSGRDHDWTRAVVFTVGGSVINAVQLFEDDQLAYDAWLPGGSATGAEESLNPDEPVEEPVPSGPPLMTGELDDPRVRAVLSYQRQVAAGDIESARAVFWPDVTYTVPGRSPLAGTYRGPDEVMGYFGRLFALTGGTYSISRMNWMTSPDRVGLLTRNHATREGRSLTWEELIVFTFVDGRKKSIAHFSGDQYGVDALLG